MEFTIKDLEGLLLDYNLYDPVKFPKTPTTVEKLKNACLIDQYVKDFCDKFYDNEKKPVEQSKINKLKNYMVLLHGGNRRKFNSEAELNNFEQLCTIEMANRIRPGMTVDKYKNVLTLNEFGTGSINEYYVAINFDREDELFSMCNTPQDAFNLMAVAENYFQNVLKLLKSGKTLKQANIELGLVGNPIPIKKL